MIQIRQKKNAMQIDCRKQYLDKYFKQIRSKFQSNNRGITNPQHYSGSNQSEYKMQEQKELSKSMQKIISFYDVSLNNNGLIEQIENNNLIDTLQGIINEIIDNFNICNFQQIILNKAYSSETNLNQNISSLKSPQQLKLQQSLGEIKYLLILIANILKDKLRPIWTEQLVFVSMKMIKILNIFTLNIQTSRKDRLKLQYILEHIEPEMFTYFMCRIFYIYRYLDEQEQIKIEEEIYPFFYNILFFAMQSEVNMHLHLSRFNSHTNQADNNSNNNKYQNGQNQSNKNKNIVFQSRKQPTNNQEHLLQQQGLSNSNTFTNQITQRSYFQKEYSVISFNQDIVKCLHEFIDHQQSLYQTYTLQKIKRNITFIKRIITSHYQLINQYEQQSIRDQRIINWVMSSYFGLIQEKLYWLYSYLSIYEDKQIIQEILKKAQLIGLIMRGCNYAGAHLKPAKHSHTNNRNHNLQGTENQHQKQTHYINYSNNNNDNNDKNISSSYQINSYCFCLLKSLMKNNVMTGLIKTIIVDQTFLDKLFSKQRTNQERTINQYISNISMINYIQQKAAFIQFIVGQFYRLNSYEEIVAAKWKQILDFSFEIIQSYTEMNMSMIRNSIPTIIKALHILVSLIQEGTNEERLMLNQQRRNKTNSSTNSNTNNKYLLYWNSLGGNNLIESLNMLIKHKQRNYQQESEQDMDDMQLLVDHYMMQQFQIE